MTGWRVKMKKFLKIATCFLLAVVFSITLSGCTKKATPGTNLVVWGFEEEDSWKPVIKAFIKDNKGSTVTYVKQTFDADYENRVLNSTLSGAGPDVWAMPNDWVYRHKEKLAPMPEGKLKKTIDLDKQYVPSIKESVYFKDSKGVDQIYALSPSAQPLMVYYNPKLFSDAVTLSNETNRGDSETKKINNALLTAPPKTWTEFSQAVNLLTVKDADSIAVSGVALGTDNITDSADILYLLMMQNETKILSDDAKLATFNLPQTTSTGADDNPGVRALEFYTSFADPNSENYSWDDSLGNNIDAFANGQVAMIFGFSDLQNTLAQKYPNFKYKRTFVPQLDQDANKVVDYAKFTAFGVSRSAHSATAWNLVATLSGSGTDTTNTNFNTANHLYSSKKAKDYDTSFTARTGTSPEKLSLATAKSLVRGRYPNELDTLIKGTIATVSTGTQDAQSSLDGAASKATELLRKTDW